MWTSARTTLARTEDNAPTPKEATAVPVLLDTKERTATKVSIVVTFLTPRSSCFGYFLPTLRHKYELIAAKTWNFNHHFLQVNNYDGFFFVRCQWMSEQSLPERRTVHEHEGKLQLFLCCWIRREELRQRWVLLWPFFPPGSSVSDISSRPCVTSMNWLKVRVFLPTGSICIRMIEGLHHTGNSSFGRCGRVSEQALPERRTMRQLQRKLQLFLCCRIRRKELRQR